MIFRDNLSVTEVDELIFDTHIRCNHLHVCDNNDIMDYSCHKHDVTEIGYILGGNGKYVIDGVKYDAKVGDVFFVPAGIQHCEVNVGEPFKLIYISTIHLGKNAAILDEVAKKLKGCNCIQQDRIIYELFENICDDVILKFPGYISSLDSRIKLLYIILLREKIFEESGRPLQKPALSERNIYVLKELKQYILENLDQKLSFEAIARKFFYHPKYLSQLIKNDTGMTLSKYIYSLRMQKAREMLSETKMTIEEISAYLGFSSVQHFYSCFKKEFNLTPTVFRKSFNDCTVL